MTGWYKALFQRKQIPPGRRAPRRHSGPDAEGAARILDLPNGENAAGYFFWSACWTTVCGPDGVTTVCAVCADWP